MNDDVTAILKLVKTVCQYVPEEHLAVSLEPFHSSWQQCWRARVVLYSDAAHTNILAVLAQQEIRENIQTIEAQLQSGPRGIGRVPTAADAASRLLGQLRGDLRRLGEPVENSP